jgi:hypothetical protein
MDAAPLNPSPRIGDSTMPTETLAPADFDLDLEVAEIVESEMSAQKTGVTDICTTIYWPCRK